MIIWLILLIFGHCSADITSEYTKGRNLFEQGRFTEAEEVWKKLIKVAPEFETLWTNLGTTYEQQGKFEEAVQLYKTALKTFSSTEEENLFARLCEVRTRQYLDATIKGHGDQIRGLTSTEAKEYCRIALDRHPDKINLWLTTGMLYTEILQPEKAVPYLQEGIRRAPTFIKLYSTLGTTYSRLGKLKEAAEYAKKAIDLDPSIAENWHSQAIARSVAFNEDAEAHASHIKAIDLRLHEVKSDGCPNGFTALYGWHSIPQKLKSVINIEILEESDGARFGSPQPRLPDPVMYPPPADLTFPNLEWTDRFSVLVTLKDVYLEGATGIFYHTPKCTVYTGGHMGSSKVHTEFRGEGAVTKIAYPVASILQQNPGNYYHWMVEVFSRFLYLHKHLLMKPGNEKMKVLVPQQASNLVRGTIVDLMKFPESRLMYFSRDKGDHERYHFSKVYLADWYWQKDHDLHPTDCSASYFPPRKALQHLRETLGGPKQMIPHTKKSPIKVVYITREDATVRKIDPADERKLIMIMADMVGMQNIEWALLEGLSVGDQISLFLNATIIVAPHGAGMTNMIWARPGTSIIQFPMNPNTDQCFGYLAQSLDFDYWMVPLINSYYYGVFPQLQNTRNRLDQELANHRKRAQFAPELNKHNTFTFCKLSLGQ